jgi:hypothetical protein
MKKSTNIQIPLIQSHHTRRDARKGKRHFFPFVENRNFRNKKTEREGFEY